MRCHNKSARNGFYALRLFFLLVCVIPSFAQNEGTAVSVETSSKTAVAGSPWTITLLINCDTPDAVTVIAPSFAAQLSLDRIIKVPKITGMQIQTAVEYRFIPNKSGNITLDPFTVITPAGITETNRIILEIRSYGADLKQVTPKIVWEGAPRQMTAGERVILTLRIHGWNSQSPPPAFFMPEVPMGVILASSAPSSQERAGGIALKLTLIPLAPADFNLPARVLEYENYMFEIPALHIRITNR